MYFDITESFSYVREIANPDALLWTTRFITLTRMPRYWSALMSPTLVTILTGCLSLPDTSLMECPSMASPMSRQETCHLLLFREHVLATIPTVATLFLISTCPLQFTRCQLTSNPLLRTTTLIRLYKRDFGEFRLPVMSQNQCSVGCLVAGPLTHLVYQLWDTT